MAATDLEPLETTLRLLQAQQLARRGRLREAMNVLAPAGTPPGESVLLQAMAALATGAGDYRKALPLWRLLLEREPGHAEARRMIYVIELWQARPAWMRWFWPAVGAVAGIGVVVALLLVL